MDNEKKEKEQKEDEPKASEQEDSEPKAGEQEDGESEASEQKDGESEDSEQEDSESEDGEQEDSEPKASEKKEVERKKIFLVDDTEFSLVRTKQLLKDYYTVYTFDSALRMFLLIEKVRPDLIILDINMPDVDGYDTLKTLKDDSQYSEIPVIFLSGKYDEESIIKGLGLGAVDHVIKPYTPKDLMDRIASHLHPLPYHDELRVDRDKNVSKPSILAVDDSPSMLRSIHFALHAKYKVHTLQKPENLQKNLRGLKPDLILLDYNMPVVNGFELVKIIREFPEFAKTPIIFLTSESSHEHLNEAVSLGINGYIIKPFNPKKLRDKVAQCLVKK